MAKWTEEEKSQFMLQLIGNAIKDGTKFDISKITINGRTQRALGHQWEDLRNSAKAAVGAGGSDAKKSTDTTMKSKTPTPGAQKRTAREAGILDEPITPTPAKRVRKTPKKEKKEDDEDVKSKTSESDEPIFKHQPVLDDSEF